MHPRKTSQKLHHHSTTPSATPSDLSHFEYLPKISKFPTSLVPIEERLKIIEPYTPVAVADFAPTDRKRYRYIFSLYLSLTHTHWQVHLQVVIIMT